MHATRLLSRASCPATQARLIALDRVEHQLEHATSIEIAIQSVCRSLSEIANGQPFAIYLEKGRRFRSVAASCIDASPEFDRRGSLARYLREHRRPVMAGRSRQGRAMLLRLDAKERDGLIVLGAVALAPLFELGRLVGFVVVGGAQWNGRFHSVDPILASALAACLTETFTRLRMREEPAPPRPPWFAPGLWPTTRPT